MWGRLLCAIGWHAYERRQIYPRVEAARHMSHLVCRRCGHFRDWR